MKVLLLACLFTVSFAATIVEPEDCESFPCMIFEEEFDTFDHSVWGHEITLGGGGNWEFQAYVNNRTVTYVRNSTLFIKPGLVSDWLGEELLTTGSMNFWGSQGRNEECTGNFFYGCERAGTATNILNPIMSGRIRTLDRFSFRYGRVEVRAKTPRGDWLWPAFWMLPQDYPYGLWPSSGEIDIIESRGNDVFGDFNNTISLSTLHWGPYFALNRYERTTQDYTTTDGVAFPDGFHTWRLDWTDQGIVYSLDDVVVYTIDPGSSFWDYGEFEAEGNIANIWDTGNKMTPFDQPMYFLINLAVGGTGGFFADGVEDSKPWLNTDGDASLRFWNDKDNWLPTWTQGEEGISEGAAFQIDSVRVWKMTSVEM